jgi:outer membrane murein-binding lipoprotein Lpp
MNKLWLLLVIPILIFTGLACVDSGGGDATNSLATQIATLTAKDASLQSSIDSTRSELSQKASKSEIDDVNRKINNLPQSGGSTPADMATKAIVDQKIADAISALKADQAWIKSVPVSGGGGGTVSDTGAVTYTNNPVSIPQIFSSSSGGNSNPWIMTIHNGSTTWQYVKPMISLNVASGQSSSLVSEVLVMTSGGSCSLTGTYSGGTSTGNFTFSPMTMNTTATPSIVAFPLSGCNGSGEWYIGPGQTQSYNIQIQGLKTPNPILWNVSASISSRSM